MMSIDSLNARASTPRTLSFDVPSIHTEHPQSDSIAQKQAEYAQFRARLVALGARQDDPLRAGDLNAIELPQLRQPRATPAMRVPSPVYMNPVPDVVVQGPEQVYVVNNAQRHVRHNRLADARYEAAMEMAGPSRTGRAAMWWSREVMPYTTDIASTGVSAAELMQFCDGIDQINIEGNERVFDWCMFVPLVLICGATLCCLGKDAYQTPKWSDQFRSYKMGIFCEEQNEKLHARGVRAAFRANLVPGVGFKLELHHLG